MADDSDGEDLSERIAALKAENYDLRHERKQLREERRRLLASDPGENGIVLTGDDAKAWERYKALGSPEVIERAQVDAADLARFRNDEVVKRAGAIAKFKPALLGRLLSADALELEFGTSRREGMDTPTVNVKGADGKLVPLEEYAASHWPDALPTLRAGTDSRGRG
jgi:hypothetical protein